MVAAEARDILLNPSQSNALIAKSTVWFVASIFKLLGGEESWHADSVTVRIRLAACNRGIYKSPT